MAGKWPFGSSREIGRRSFGMDMRRVLTVFWGTEVPRATGRVARRGLKGLHPDGCASGHGGDTESNEDPGAKQVPHGRKRKADGF